MRVLVGCEFSGVIRDAFREQGHAAYSCDIREGAGDYHIIGDVLEVVCEGGWDLFIVHPPCTYLCASGLFRNKNNPKRTERSRMALEFFGACLQAPVPKVCVENPVGLPSAKYGPPTQYIQPYEFGEDASKKTGLWLKGLPPLKPTGFVRPRMVRGRPRWGNQSDSGQNNEPGTTRQSDNRSRTYPGVAKAMAVQWGKTTKHKGFGLC